MPDVALKEGHGCVGKDQAPENFAVLRHMAPNLPKQEKTAKGGIHAKHLQTAWKKEYLHKVLSLEFRCDCPKLPLESPH